MQGLLNKVLLAAAVSALSLASASTSASAPATGDAGIAEKLRHEVVMYPRYTIWDNVNFRVDSGHVELMGQVSQPFKSADLVRIAKSVPGVASVTNELKVLPLSGFDDQLRFRVARAVYGYPALSRYGLGALPSIHIIVDNGRVTLEGVVANDMDKQLAGVRANQAGLSFGAVTNNLRVERAAPKKG